MTSKILSLIEIFSDLSQAQLDLIYKICREESYIKGQVIFEEHSPSKEIFIIVEGVVDILVNTGKWEDITEITSEVPASQRITTLERGQSFGEIALVDAGLRSASAICASENCKLLVINRDDFMDLMRSHLDIGFVVMYNLASALCTKIRSTTFRVREGLIYSSKKPDE